MTQSSTDQSGKQDFGDIYDAPDPRAYWRGLAALGYQIPQHAQGAYAELVAARRDMAGGGQVTVSDLCCSYGTTAALLNHDCTLEDLYERYCSDELDGLSEAERAARDMHFYAQRRRPSPARVVGIDTAANAVSYALRAGLLDAAIAENLEDDGPSRELQRAVADTDLVTVTGGVGYIGPATFDRVLSHITGTPWVAAFVLRWIDYGPSAETLADHGLVTERLTGRTFPQRRFADDAERDYVLSILDDMGVDPAGKEADGEHHASFYLSRPETHAVANPVDDWLGASR